MSLPQGVIFVIFLSLPAAFLYIFHPPARLFPAIIHKVTKMTSTPQTDAHKKTHLLRKNILRFACLSVDSCFFPCYNLNIHTGFSASADSICSSARGYTFLPLKNKPRILPRHLPVLPASIISALTGIFVPNRRY